MYMEQALTLGSKLRKVLHDAGHVATVSESADWFTVAITADTINRAEFAELEQLILNEFPTSTTGSDVNWAIDSIGTFFVITFNIRVW